MVVQRQGQLGSGAEKAKDQRHLHLPLRGRGHGFSGVGEEMIDQLKVRELQVDEIKSLYNERLTRDFPPDELKPFTMIMSALERDAYICYGALVEESILAYAFFVKCGNDALIDYYAVREDIRDAGIGSRFMQELISGPLQGMNCVLLEVEDPDCSQNVRERDIRNSRLSFYMRNGLVETGVKSIVWDVPYCVLELPLAERHSTAHIRNVYGGIYHAFMSEKVYNERVRII
jgi:GNAT superfamily N-acetyltransferase